MWVRPKPCLRRRSENHRPSAYNGVVTRTITHVWTAADLLRLPPEQRCELIEGELILLSPSGHAHGHVAANLAGLLHVWNREHRIGRVYGAETGFLLQRDPDTVRAPDCAFVANDRVVHTLRGFFPGSPDFAAEVVSPDQTEEAVLDKARFWLDHGVKLVLIAWPTTRSIMLLRPDQEPQLLHDDNPIDGGDVLPGFRCEVREVFE